MNDPALDDELITQVADLNEKAVIDIVEEKLKQGADPYHIIELCNKGIQIVGNRYEEGYYFVAGLIMAGVILRNVMEMIAVDLENFSGVTNDVGKNNIIIGTVEGDIHDIGKNLGGIILSCTGFNVIDLGVDVSSDVFIEAIRQHQADIVVLSCMMTSAFHSAKSIVASFEKAGIREKLSVLVAGGQIDERICKYVNADHWTNDAIKGAQWCRQVLKTT